MLRLFPDFLIPLKSIYSPCGLEIPVFSSSIAVSREADSLNQALSRQTIEDRFHLSFSLDHFLSNQPIIDLLNLDLDFRFFRFMFQRLRHLDFHDFSSSLPHIYS